MKTLKTILKPISLVAIVLFVLTSCTKDDDTAAPMVKASFTYVINNETGAVNFTNTSENANTYVWSFGDGETSTDINPTHVFDEGVYTVTLTAKNASGGTSTSSSVITIEGVPPVVNNLLTNGDFEDGATGWIGNVDVRTEGGNSYNFANVASAGNAYDVNLSKVVTIVQGKTYRLTFSASSDRTRTLVAGIGLNQDPWTNATQIVNLTTTTQTFELELSASEFGGANSRVIFDMGAAVGVVVIDNVILEEIQGSGPSGDNLLTNGDFESGTTGWIGEALDVRTEGGNSYAFANVATAGNAYDVNISNVVAITQGKTYILTFDASSDGNRTLIAGIGLNQDPWTNSSQTVNLTTTMQPFTLELSAAEFGNSNSRVLFDMGADTGVVVIDNVTLKEKL